MLGEIKSAIFVGAGAIALGAVVWKLYNSNNKEEQTQQSIPDQILIRFLKDLRAQCYPHYFLVAGIVRQVKQQSGSNFDQIFQRVKDEVELLFQKKQSMILFKLDLDLDNVQQSLISTKNEQVKILNEQIQKLYDDALEGIDPPLNLNPKTTQKYTQEQLLTIMGKILKVSVQVICLAIQELEKSGNGLPEYKLDQPNFMRALNNNGITDRKLEILIQENLTEFEEPDSCPIELFSKLIQFHKVKTPKFKKCVDDVESHFEFIISRLLKREIDSEGAINAAEKIDLVQIMKMLQ